jgi:H+/Cl- antiporter ClcA
MWNGMLVGMIVGVTVGLQAPLTAAFVVPEMAGDLGLFPVAVLVALTAVMVDRVMVDRLIDMRRGRSSGGANVTLHDEDA